MMRVSEQKICSRRKEVSSLNLSAANTTREAWKRTYPEVHLHTPESVTEPQKNTWGITGLPFYL